MLRPAAVLLALLLAGCSPEPVPKKAEAPPKPAPVPEVYRVKLETTKGDIVIEVRRAWAPAAADRFHELVRQRFFDDAAFYRVMRNYIAQFGIHKDPKVSELWRLNRMPDDRRRESNRKGTVAFAHSGPGTRTTQVFINLADNLQLDGQGFAPFGKVVSGMDVAAKLYAGYGDSSPRGYGPDAAKLENQGNAILASFPRLDYIKTARFAE
jgi:peptidyl-prolyl cis-trans isomerase A (cyclophilin A)